MNEWMEWMNEWMNKMEKWINTFKCLSMMELLEEPKRMKCSRCAWKSYLGLRKQEMDGGRIQPISRMYEERLIYFSLLLDRHQQAIQAGLVTRQIDEHCPKQRKK